MEVALKWGKWPWRGGRCHSSDDFRLYERARGAILFSRECLCKRKRGHGTGFYTVQGEESRERGVDEKRKVFSHPSGKV